MKLNSNKSSKASANEILEHEMQEYVRQLRVHDSRNDSQEQAIQKVFIAAQIRTDPVKTTVRQNDGKDEKFKGM